MQAAEQAPELVGRVVIGSVEERPAGGVEVALHRITRREGGVVARDVTDGEGRFRFSLARDDPDAFPIYLVTAHYREILYFGPPVHDPPTGHPDYMVRVHDTVGSEAFTAARRTLTVTAEPDALRVMDVLELSNPTDSTLLPVTPEAPGWMLALPEGATEVTRVGEAMEPAEPRMRGGGVIVETPIPPGGRDVAIRYRLPGPLLRLRLERPLPMLEILLPAGLGWESTVGLERASSVRVGDAPYARLAAAGLDIGQVVEVRLGITPTRPWGWILVGIGCVLAVAAFLSARLPAASSLRRAPRRT